MVGIFHLWDFHTPSTPPSSSRLPTGPGTPEGHGRSLQSTEDETRKEDSTPGFGHTLQRDTDTGLPSTHVLETEEIGFGVQGFV